MSNKINWNQIPRWLNFVAMDKNETWQFYSNRPVLNSEEEISRYFWRQENPGFLMRVPEEFAPKFSGDWTESLISR